MKSYDFLPALQILRTRLQAPDQAEASFTPLLERFPQARRAAVLLALFEHEGQLSLPFIRRSTTLRAHSGQIAFPGGGIEPEDASPIETALRETREEIGASLSQVEILGTLPPLYTFVSNYLVLPVVSYFPHGLGQLQLQPSEVDEVIITTIEGLADPRIARSEVWRHQEHSGNVYFYDYGPTTIWGATGAMLNAFLQLFPLDSLPGGKGNLPHLS